MPTSVSSSKSSRGRIGNSEDNGLREATFRMWRSIRSIRRVPREIANIIYGFTRAEPRCRRGHLLGAWPAVARACAKMGAPLMDVMAPAYEVERELKRDVYRRALPPLTEVEIMEADVVHRIQAAEIAGDVRGLREAAHEECWIAELLEEVADQQLDAKSA